MALDTKNVYVASKTKLFAYKLTDGSVACCLDGFDVFDHVRSIRCGSEPR